MDFWFLLYFLVLMVSISVAVIIIAYTVYSIKLYMWKKKCKKALLEAEKTGIWWEWDNDRGWLTKVDPLYKIDELADYPDSPPYDKDHPEPNWAKELRVAVEEQNECCPCCSRLQENGKEEKKILCETRKNKK